MIIADANLIAHYVLRNDMRPIARQCRQRDPDWIAPTLWRVELLNVLSKHLRSKDPIPKIDLAEAVYSFERATKLVRDWPSAISPQDVLAVVAADHVSAYDAHYAIVARAAGCRIVTLDRPLRVRLPRLCVSIQDFADGR